MFMTRKRLTALVVASALFMGVALTLSGGEEPKANQPEAQEDSRTSEMLRPTQNAPMPPRWLVSDFSWM